MTTLKPEEKKKSLFQIGKEFLVNGNYKEAVKNFLSSIENDESYDSVAYLNYSYYYCQWDGLQLNKQWADTCLSRAAEKGNLTALAFHNHFIKKDIQEAIKYYKILVEKEDDACPIIQTELGHLLSESKIKDDKEAFRLFESAATKWNYYIAEINLANAYYTGRGVQKDLYKAFHYWQLASRLSIHALFNIAACYFNGEGVAKNEQKAIKIYEECIEKKYPPAAHHLGLIYEKTYLDEKKALEYYELAAKQGNLESMKAVIIFYNNRSEVVKKDETKVLSMGRQHRYLTRGK